MAAAAPVGRARRWSSGARVVVVHPPFTWQRDYARGFAAGLRRLGRRVPEVCRSRWRTCIPLRVRGREFVPYVPGWDPTRAGFDAYTLDVSHCAAARIDALAMADAMGDGLAHVHLGDGTGEGRDEHLVPGRGSQPCAALLATLAGRGLHRLGRGGGGHPAGAVPGGAPGRPGRVAGVRPGAPGDSLHSGRHPLTPPMIPTIMRIGGPIERRS